MKQKKGLIVTSLILFAINWIATTLSGYAAIFTAITHMPMLNKIWAVFNAFVGMVAAILLLIAAICAFKEKGNMLAAAAFFLCSVQNFLSFIPNWRMVAIGVRHPLQLIRIIGLDWLCAAAYILLAIAALTKWKGKTLGVIGGATVLSVRVFAIFRTVFLFVRGGGAGLGQILPGLLVNFVFCILTLNLGILLYVMAQKKKTE